MLNKTTLATFGLLLGGALAQDTVPTWKAIQTGLDTLCADGSPYRFYEQQGDPRKLVLDFMGGGACWNEGTCNPASKTYVPGLQNIGAPAAVGIHDPRQENNPVRGWSRVYVPYCTADLHWGNATTQHGSFTIQHRGAANATAVLNHVFQKYPDLEQVLVTGCSAGSYGSIMWAPKVMEHYPNARILQMGDAGLGVNAAGFSALAARVWGIEATLPTGKAELNRLKENLQNFSVPGLYQAAANAYPQHRFSQLTSTLDLVQIGFYGLMKGVTKADPQLAAEWAQAALTQLGTVQAGAPNFKAFVYPGQDHCVINRPEFYTTTVNGTPLTTWLARNLQGEPNPSVLP